MIGVLVMAYGGPNSLEEVEPYLMDVRGYRLRSHEILEEVRERYRLIGGRSPILERTMDQAAALEAALNRGSPPARNLPPAGGRSVTLSSPSPSGQRNSPLTFKTFVGMRHWHPYIKDALAEMRRVGITHAVGLVMAPHYSRMSIGAYYKKVEESASPIDVVRIERWHLLPGYLDAVAARVRAALDEFPLPERPDVTVVFTAHSLPKRIRDWGDRYEEELSETVTAIMERLGPQPHEFAFQSAAMTPEPWLGPDARDVIERLAKEERKRVIIAPIGFTTEHVEILYDVDHEMKRKAAALDMRLERMQMLNHAPEMVSDLADLVREKAAERGWIREATPPRSPLSPAHAARKLGS